MLLLIIDILLVGISCWIIARVISRVRLYRIILTKDIVLGMLIVAYVLPVFGMNLIDGWHANRLIAPQLRYQMQDTEIQLLYRVIVGCSIAAVFTFGSSRNLVRTLRARDVRLFSEGSSKPLLVPNSHAITAIYALSWAILLAAPFSIFINPQLSAYLVYQTPSERFHGAAATFAHEIVTFITTLAVFCYILILWIELRKHRQLLTFPVIVAFFLALVSSYIHGKRSIVFMFFLATAALSYLEGRAKIRYIFGSAILFLVFMQAYVIVAKPSPNASIAGDLFRDYTLLPVLAGAEWTRHESMPRGAGFTFQWLFWVPRHMWPEKPWPTPVYVTRWILGTKQDLQWGFGLGYLEDGITNFGYLGAGLYLIAVVFACRISDRFIYRKRRTIYAVLWLPIAYGCVFAFSVLIKLILFIVIPVLLVGRLLTKDENWIPSGENQSLPEVSPDALGYY